MTAPPVYLAPAPAFPWWIPVGAALIGFALAQCSLLLDEASYHKPAALTGATVGRVVVLREFLLPAKELRE